MYPRSDGLNDSGTSESVFQEGRKLIKMSKWEEPFIIDDQRFRATFGVKPTEQDQAAADTVAWAKSHYKP